MSRNEPSRENFFDQRRLAKISGIKSQVTHPCHFEVKNVAHK
jgi:hypothetical protein